MGYGSSKLFADVGTGTTAVGVANRQQAGPQRASCCQAHRLHRSCDLGFLSSSPLLNPLGTLESRDLGANVCWIYYGLSPYNI